MSRTVLITLQSLILLLVSATANGNAANLDDAIKIYYAGLPDQAIAILKPLAQSGDIEAQLLLGNMLHSLSRSVTAKSQDDPVTWYQMAAAQGSAEANYLLGVTYHNRWATSQEMDSNSKAIAYYETALKLGNKTAQGPLVQLKYRNKTATKNKPVAKPESIEAPEEKIPEIIAASKADLPKEIEVPNAVPEIEIEPLEPMPEVIVEQTIEEIIENEDIAANKIFSDKSDEVLRKVDLLDLVTECKNFTQAGFMYYAESIKNAHLTGSATIRSILPYAGSDDTLTVHLTKKILNVELLLVLSGVPEAVGKRLEKSAIYSISGIVGEAQKTPHNCEINLAYEPIKLVG